MERTYHTHQVELHVVGQEVQVVFRTSDRAQAYKVQNELETGLSDIERETILLAVHHTPEYSQEVQDDVPFM